MYPQIELELSIANRVVDFVEEGYDLAIRLGIPPDSRLIAHKLEEASVGIFGAPTYLAQRGIPQTLEDLEAHDCIQFVLPSTGRPMSWLFRDENGKDIEIVSRSRMRVHDDALGCISWARAGGGLFQTYHFSRMRWSRTDSMSKYSRVLAGVHDSSLFCTRRTVTCRRRCGLLSTFWRWQSSNAHFRETCAFHEHDAGSAFARIVRRCHQGG